MIHPDAKKYTHYSYLSCPVGVKREPTGLFNLSASPVFARKRLMRQLNISGELLAKLPFSDITDMRQLRGALQWLHDNK